MCTLGRVPPRTNFCEGARTERFQALRGCELCVCGEFCDPGGGGACAIWLAALRALRPPQLTPFNVILAVTQPWSMWHSLSAAREFTKINIVVLAALLRVFSGNIACGRRPTATISRSRRSWFPVHHSFAWYDVRPQQCSIPCSGFRVFIVHFSPPLMVLLHDLGSNIGQASPFRE